MKFISAIIVSALVVVTICVIYLLKSGVSLHSAPYIAPSTISMDLNNISKGIFVRLFPDLQKSDYILWGLQLDDSEQAKVFSDFKERFEQEFKIVVHVIKAEDIQNCVRPCWVILPLSEAHGLESNLWIQNNLSGKEYISISWIDFTKGIRASDECLHMKFLNLTCLASTAVQEVERKMKNKDQRYFFMRKYQDHDYFLFVEKVL